MPYQVTPSDSSPLDQITSGLATGTRIFTRLLVMAILIATAGTLLYKFGARRSGESDEAVTTHHNIRRNIAMGVRGPAVGSPLVPVAEAPKPWHELRHSIGRLGAETRFEARIEIRHATRATDYRVIFGPYDPVVSQSFKNSSGWVTLDFLGPNGRPVYGLEQGVKIRLSSFEFHENGGIPVGWIYHGSLGRQQGLKVSDFESFKIGWVIPTRTSISDASSISKN